MYRYARGYDKELEKFIMVPVSGPLAKTEK
jgi:hypothetical protein